MMSPTNTPAPTNKRHQPSQEEWKELKAKIWQLYIKEDKSLDRVVKLLSEKQGFVLTKRQLTRKLNEWRFRKNTRAIERQSFLLNKTLSSDESLGSTTGIKVTNTKIKRWKRESTKEPEQVSGGDLNQALGPSNREPTPPIGISHPQIDDSLSSGDNYPISDIFLERSNLSWPFSSNSEDPGPVFLSKLFSTLSITPPFDLNSYATRFPKPETPDPAEFQHLSSTQYNDLTSGNSIPQALLLGDCRVWNIAARQSASTSPFNEICFFAPFEPNQFSSSRARKPNHLTQTTIDQHRILELEEKLSKLQGLLPETHPAMFAILHGLFHTNGLMANYKLAEHWCRRIITIRQRVVEAHSPQNLFDHVRLSIALISQGKSVEAKELQDQLYPDIKRNDSFVCVLTGESLAAKYLEAQAKTAQLLGSNGDAASYSNQLVQLRLSTLGPYDGASLFAMTMVADSLMELGIYDESIRILRLMLQLQERFRPFAYQPRCIGMRKLAIALRKQNHYKESVAVARRSAQLAEEYLGSDQHTTLLNKAALGSCLRAFGLLSESEAVLRGVVARRISIYGGDDLKTIFDMGDLGRVLMETGNYEEATTWYENAFRRLLETLGWKNWWAVVYCGSLGKCYENQGRYIDGIALYEQALHEDKTLKRTRRPFYHYFICQLAECYLQERWYPEAISICRSPLLDIADKMSPEDQRWERRISAKLAEANQQQRKSMMQHLCTTKNS